MKTLIFFATICTVTAARADQGRNYTAIANVSDAFVPASVEAHEAIPVTVSGMFPNNCYSYDTAQVSERDRFTQVVRVFADVKDSICLMRMTPFLHEFKMGPLAPGEHTVIFINGDGSEIERKLIVEG
jgi:hypothetical protein